MMKKVFIIALPQETECVSSILNIPVIYSGVGKVNATIAAMTAIQSGYTTIINVGSCGSMNLGIGEIVKIDNFFEDIDCSPLCDYGHPFLDSIQSIKLNYNSVKSCFTTDYFYDNSLKDKYSSGYLNMIQKCDVFDMESYSIAKVCQLFNVEFICYKWISDDGESSDWMANCRIGLEKIKELLSYEFEEERI